MKNTDQAMRTVCAVKSGDYYEFAGSDAIAVARTLGLTLLTKALPDGSRTHCTAFAAHMAAHCIEQLRADGWYCEGIES